MAVPGPQVRAVPAGSAFGRTWARLGVAGAVAVCAGGAHLVFLLSDARLPPDRNRVYTDLPTLTTQLGSLSTVKSALYVAATTTTGWYNLALAMVIRLMGHADLVFALANLGWLALLLCATAVIAARIEGGGPGRESAWGAAAAVALTASAPLVIGYARMGWIHIPEAALALAILAVWGEDPGLTRRGSRVGIAVSGAALIALRTSGLLWAVTLLPVLLSGWRVGRSGYFRRLAWTLSGWGGGLVPVLVVGQAYLEDKLAARARYVAMVSPLGFQLQEQIGLPVLLLMGAGLLALLTRRARFDGPAAILAVLGAWIVVPFALTAVFGVGIDNFPQLVPALAILGGLGLAHLRWWLTALPLGLWGLILLSFWLPTAVADRVLGVLPGMPLGLRDDHANNVLRVYTTFGYREVGDLLAASCPDSTVRHCRIAVDRGLFDAMPEEPGSWELFLLGEDRVALYSLADGPPVSREVDALARFGCTGSDAAWVQRFPRALLNGEAVIQAQSLSLAWRRQLEGGCSYEWWTPGGAFLDANAAPE